MTDDETPSFDLGDFIWAPVGEDLFRFLFTLRDHPQTPAPLYDLIQAKILSIAYPNGVPEEFSEPDELVVE